MTTKTIYSILRGKNYYNGMSALGVQGLRIHAINDSEHVKSMVVGSSDTVWIIYYCTGFHGRPAWTVSEEMKR